MIDVYLASGFLGSGKTNFLKCFVSLFPDSKTAVIVNEFGKDGIDALLLSETGGFLAEINNGSIFCACRLARFEDVLDDMIDAKPDRIVIESSGLSDPTSVRKILGQPRFGGVIRYRGSVCIIDAVRFCKLRTTVRIISRQIAIGDLFIVNKTDLASAGDLDEIRYVLAQMRPGIPVIPTTYAVISRRELEKMDPSAGIGTDKAPELQTGHKQDLTLRKLTLEVSGEADSDLVKHGIALFADDTFRVKGLLTLKNGQFLVDCVGPHLEITPYNQVPSRSNSITVLYDNQLPARKSIEEAMRWLPEGTFRME